MSCFIRCHSWSSVSPFLSGLGFRCVLCEGVSWNIVQSSAFPVCHSAAVIFDSWIFCLRFLITRHFLSSQDTPKEIVDKFERIEKLHSRTQAPRPGELTMHTFSSSCPWIFSTSNTSLLLFSPLCVVQGMRAYPSITFPVAVTPVCVWDTFLLRCFSHMSLHVPDLKRLKAGDCVC